MSSIPTPFGPSATALSRRAAPAAIAATVVLLALVVPLLFWRTTASMVEIWERSETFAHGFLVFPIFAYLVWRIRHRLAGIAPRPFAPALAGVALAGAVWWVSERLSAPAPGQFAVVAMVPLALWAILGTALVRALAFPLAFLFFAVPMGEFLVPTMMDWTADFTVAALRASGVPVYRELNYLMLPTGMWSIVEACSGLRYLIASVTVGVLFAYLTYQSMWRRLAFIAASVVVPVLANWLRAYFIVLLGHLTNNRLAVGVDHIIYGWIFFGLVMLLLFWIAARWREDEPRLRVDAQRDGAPAFRLGPAMLAMTAAVAALALAWQAAYGEPGARAPGVARMPALAVGGGWSPVAQPLTAFRPEVSGYSGELAQTYEKNGTRVALQVLLFSEQQPGYQALSTRNHMVWNSNQWKQIAAGDAATPFGRARTGVITAGRERLAFWQWFWIDGRVTPSEYTGQVQRVLGLLQGKPDTAAWVMLYTPTDAGEDAVRARLADFAAAAGPALERALTTASADHR